MAEGLCVSQHKLLCGSEKKRKRCRCKADKCMGNFPTPGEIILMDSETLKNDCKLGTRVAWVLELAQSIENGSLKLEDISSLRDPAKCYARLLRIKGFGPFAAANVMMCVGFYQYVPIDTETTNHLIQVRNSKFSKYQVYLFCDYKDREMI